MRAKRKALCARKSRPRVLKYSFGKNLTDLEKIARDTLRWVNEIRRMQKPTTIHSLPTPPIADGGNLHWFRAPKN